MENSNNEDKQKWLEKFFRESLTEEQLALTDFNTLKHHDINFIDPEFYYLIHGILTSAIIANEIVYVYIVLSIGDELTEVGKDTVISDAKNKILIWHRKENPKSNPDPHIQICRLKANRKK